MLTNPHRETITTILKKIKALRIEKGISQYELSERLSICQNSYYKIESGKTKLDIYRLLQISTILEFNFCEYLYLNFDHVAS